MNRQRGFAITLILYALAALAVLAAVGAIVWKVQHWCNAACKDAQAETVAAVARAEAAEAAIDRAKKETARVTLAWAADSVAAQTRAIEAKGERDVRFAPIHNAARGLPAADARVRIPDSAVGVLDRAVDAGNATITRPAAGAADQARATPADPAGVVDVAGLTAWGVQVAQQYAACADQVTGWQTFYGGLQRNQLSEAIH